MKLLDPTPGLEQALDSCRSLLEAGCCIPLGPGWGLSGGLYVQLASSPLMVAAPALGGVDVDAGEPRVGRGLDVSLEATRP